MGCTGNGSIAFAAWGFENPLSIFSFPKKKEQHLCKMATL
jgi:hypothetical protein